MINLCQNVFSKHAKWWRSLQESGSAKFCLPLVELSSRCFMDNSMTPSTPLTGLTGLKGSGSTGSTALRALYGLHEALRALQTPRATGSTDLTGSKAPRSPRALSTLRSKIKRQIKALSEPKSKL